MQNLDKNSKSKLKFNQQFRKALELMEICEAKSEDLNISLEEFYENAIIYEFAYSLALFNFSEVITGGTDDTLLFLRRSLECLAYYLPYEKKLFEKINLQIFKIQAQKREVGLKEGAKIKNILHLKKSDINSALRENKYLFLHGVYANEFSYHNFVEEIFALESYKMSFIYDYLGLRSHQTNLDLLSDNFEDFDKLILELTKTYYPEKLQKALKNIKKLNKTSLIDVINNLEKEYPWLNDAFESISLFSDNLHHGPLVYYVTLVNSVWNYFSTSLILKSIGSYRGIVATFKTFIEKVAILDNLRFVNRDKASKIYVAYNFCSMYSIKSAMTKLRLLKENTTEEDMKEVYEDLIKNNTKLSYQAFINLIAQNPSYIITMKKDNFSTSVEKFFDKNFKDRKSELLESYYESVVLSHCDGFLLFKKEKDYSNLANELINFSLDYLKFLFNFFEANKLFYGLQFDENDFSAVLSNLFHIFDQIEAQFNNKTLEKEEVSPKEILRVKNIKDLLD